MTIELELKELATKLNNGSVDVKLLKNIAKYLGNDHTLLRGKIAISNKEELNNIKKNFIIKIFGVEKKKADRIIKNTLLALKNLKTVYRSTFYYYIIQEINSPKARIKNIHPGEILLEEFLKPMEISAYKLSKDIGVPQTRISMILKGERGITADTALRFSKYFGNSSKFWLGLQNDYDLEESERSNFLDFIRIKRCA